MSKELTPPHAPWWVRWCVQRNGEAGGDGLSACITLASGCVRGSMPAWAPICVALAAERREFEARARR